MGRLQHAASVRSASEMGDDLLRLFRLVGQSDAPRGRLLSAYRRARDVLATPEALRNARLVRDTLAELQSSVERDLITLWDEGADVGKMRAGQQKAIYRLDTRPRSTDRDLLRDAAVGAVTSIIARQSAAIVADVLQGRARPETVLGDGTSAGVLNPFQALGPARDQVAQAGRAGYEVEMGRPARPTEWWQQAIAAIDERTTECCLLVHGQAVPMGATFTLEGEPRYADEQEAPPFHWNAILAGEMVTTDRGAVPIERVRVGDRVLTHHGRFKRVTMAVRRRHSGAVLSIQTDCGIIRATAEHPILTADGWREAGTLWPGDTVFGCDQLHGNDARARHGVGVFAALHADNPKPGSNKRDVARAVGFGARVVPAAVNLQIDVRGGEIEVEHIFADGMLKDEVNTLLQADRDEASEPNLLAFRWVSPVSRSDFGRSLLGNAGHMDGVTPSHALGGHWIGDTRAGVGVPGELAGLRLTHAAAHDAGLDEPALYHVARYAERLCDHVFRLSSGVSLNNGAGINTHSGWHVQQYTIDRVSTLELSDATVCDLSVEDDESYCVNGIFVHNCRSALALVAREDVDDSLTAQMRGSAASEQFAREAGGEITAPSNALRGR
jgi:hypothetical protein